MNTSEIETRIKECTGEEVKGIQIYDFNYGNSGVTEAEIQRLCREADAQTQLNVPHREFALHVHMHSLIVLGLTYVRQEADGEYRLLFFSEDSNGEFHAVPLYLLKDGGRWRFGTTEEDAEAYNRFSVHFTDVSLLDLIWEPLVVFLDVLSRPDAAKTSVRKRENKPESGQQQKATEEFEFLLKARKRFSLEEVKRLCPNAWTEFSSDNPGLCAGLEAAKPKRLQFLLLPTGYIGVKIG